MDKNILLVEPSYKSCRPSLGLMKISTWHKNQNDNVTFIKDSLINRNRLNKKHYNIIYITSLFTYNAESVVNTVNFFKQKFPKSEIKVGGIMATLLPHIIKEYTNIDPHIGLLENVENCCPDYSLYPDLKYSITFTSRGCKRNCEFCAVKKHEPKFFTKDWIKDIDLNKKKIIFWDNNWLCSPNFEKDIQQLIKLKKESDINSFDFNQGLDCRLFDEEKAKLISSTGIEIIRFAFDNISEDGYIQKAIKLSQDCGIFDIRIYVLYNFKDTPEDFYYRINEINKLNACSYPMRYRPIDLIEGQYISSQWNKALLRALKLSLMFYYNKGMIRKNCEVFSKIYGENGKEFINKLYGIYDKDKLQSLKNNLKEHKKQLYLEYKTEKIKCV